MKKFYFMFVALLTLIGLTSNAANVVKAGQKYEITETGSVDIEFDTEESLPDGRSVVVFYYTSVPTHPFLFGKNYQGCAYKNENGYVRMWCERAHNKNANGTEHLNIYGYVTAGEHWCYTICDYADVETVASPLAGGGGSTGDFDGEEWQETFFKAGETTIDKNNIMIETDGAILTTVDGVFHLGGTAASIPFDYNTYGENELDWNNKCQLVFTAKDNISRIVMEGNSDIGCASADKGKYDNGVWTGALMKGETLTLTARIGITLSKITILYNGAENNSSTEGAWKFTVNSPAEGEVTELYQIVLDQPAGTMWIDEMGNMPCTLACSDGTTYTYNLYDNFSAQIVGIPVGISDQIKTPGTYTLVIPAETFHINGVGNEEQTFTWTIGGGQGGGETQNYPFDFAYNKSAEKLSLTWPGVQQIAATFNGTATIEGYGNVTFNVTSSDESDPLASIFGPFDQLAAFIVLPDGDYTLNIPAGMYTIDGVENEAISYRFTVSEVIEECEVTPDDTEGWNDLSRPHKLTLEGTFDNPFGFDGMIEYAVEESEDWHQLTEKMSSGETYNATIVVMFDTSREKHIIRFRTRDNIGNTTLLPSIEYMDVSFHQYSGIANKTYTGDSIYQEVECTDVANLQVTTGRYFNNVNAGTASFCIEGVFPYTIGRKSCTFQINPAPLNGSLNLATDSYVYNGQQFYPEWTFTNESYSTLEEGKDYNVTFTDNRYPGTAKVTVKGKGNYTSELTKTFFIDKAPLRDELFSVKLPDEDVSYDGNEHKASATANNGVGQVSFTYMLHGESTLLSDGPTEEGHYDIYMQIADGELYYGRPTEFVGSFSIYRFDEAEWQSLSLLYAELQQMGATLPWDIAGGAKNVGKFEGLTVKEGHVVGISLTNMEMSGLFPTSLVAFSKLEDVDLSGNNLSGNISTAIAAVRMKNPTAFSSLHTLNISNNRYSGNVGILGNSIPSLSNLNVSYNKFEDLYPALPATIVNIDITHQEMDRVVDLNLSELSFADMATKIPTILLYNHDIRKYNTSINLLCTKADLSTFNKYDTNEWAMQLAVSDNQISIPYVSSQNAYYGESGDVLNVLNMTGNNSTDGSTFKIALSFNPGDANFDGSINILDLQSMINYMFEEYTSKPYNFTASNLWKDEVINVQDAVSMVNILLNDNNESNQLLSKSYRVADVQQEKEPTVFVSNGNLIINAAEPVSSFDIVVATDTDCEINEDITSSGFSCATKQIGNQIHIVGYSLSGATLPIGENVLGRVDDGYVLSSMLANSEANEISTAFSSAPTGISNNVFSDESINEVYRINIGAKRTIVIGSNGKKYMQIEK